MQEMLSAKKRGDSAFREKDFKAAIDCYTQVVLSYHMCTLMQNPYGKNTRLLYLHGHLIYEYQYYVKGNRRVFNHMT